MQIVLRSLTPERLEVVFPALVYATIIEEHASVADEGLIDRTIRAPQVDLGVAPAIIVTVLAAEHPAR